MLVYYPPQKHIAVTFQYDLHLSSYPDQTKQNLFGFTF